MALASAAPANAVPEVLRNSRRVVRFESGWLVEFIGRWMFAFETFELFIAVGPIILSQPTLGKSVQPHRPAIVLLDDREHQIAIDLIEAVLVHAKHGQRVARYPQRDVALRANFSIVADAPQQSIRDARRAPAASRDFAGARS